MRKGVKETYGYSASLTSLTLPLKERTWRETFMKGSFQEYLLNHAY